MPIEKQIWIAMLMEGFYPDRTFLTRSVDMTAMVEYNKINLAEAGVAPDVLIDNTEFPVPTASRTDVALELPLHTFDTKNTVFVMWKKWRRPMPKWRVSCASTVTPYRRKRPHTPLIIGHRRKQKS